MKKQIATAAILDLADAMDGNELDALISALAEVRKDKQPGVAQKRPSPTDPLAMDTPVTIEDAQTLRDWFAANVEGDSNLFSHQIGQAH